MFFALFCVFLHRVLTNDVLQISLNAAKMVLVMKRQIQHVVALFSRSNNNVTITHTFELSRRHVDSILIILHMRWICNDMMIMTTTTTTQILHPFALVIACTCSDWLQLIVSCFMCEFWIFNFIVSDMNSKISRWKWGALLQSLQNNDDYAARRSH